jgi:preprotein translocase subunit SecD
MVPVITNVVPSWVVMAFGATLVALLMPRQFFVSGLIGVLAIAIVIAFVLQVAFYRREGLVSRLSLALTGNVLITALFAVAFVVLGAVD